MAKLIQFKINEAAKYFYRCERTDNETYLLNIILDLGREYNKLVDEYNILLHESGKMNNSVCNDNSDAECQTRLVR